MPSSTALSFPLRVALKATSLLVSAGCLDTPARPPALDASSPDASAPICGVDDTAALALGAPHPSEPCRLCGPGFAFIDCPFGCRPDGTCAAVTGLATGTSHGCALTDDGALNCWGWRADGQIGDGERAQEAATPHHVSALPPARAVTAGDRHTCALADGDNLYCWGINHHALVTATPGVTHAEVPTYLAVPAVRSVDTGTMSTCVVRTDRRVACWGFALDGQRFGNETPRTATSPKPVVGLEAVHEVQVGAGYACALGEDGAVRCWGDGVDGHLGGATSSATPVAIDTGGSPVSAMSVGAAHACAIAGQGERLYCWGRNDEGELGVAVGDEPGGPIEVADALSLATPLSAVAVGHDFSCVIDASGEVRCWGSNRDLTLGRDTVDPSEPTQRVALSEPARAIAAGSHHACALGASGFVWCWGLNGGGQLGNGRTDPPRSARPLHVRR